MKLSEEQKAAISLATDPNVRLCAISGGAGCGKTSLIKELVEYFGTGLYLCAFTGKAAARISEASGAPACTIHRMLKYNGKTFQCKSIDYPIIIDESSMVSSYLLAEIIRTNPPKLILVGDDAQLPPVGTGAPFNDFLKYYPDRCINLSKSFRATQAIFKAGHAIRNGESPLLSDSSGGETFKMIKSTGPDETIMLLRTWMEIPGFWDPHKDVLISPINGKQNDGGIKELNEMMIKIFNPREGQEKWKVGDRIINTKNINKIAYYNGDVGTITAIDAAQRLYIKLDRQHEDGELVLGKEAQKNLQFAYALTTHRSQGSEYRKVIFVCLANHRHSLNRAMIYTAVTRAQKACAVVGHLNSFIGGIKRIDKKETIINQLKRRHQ
jgi:exodeoxyribonuclease V alpha subunit